jgi:hypothetical protein
MSIKKEFLEKVKQYYPAFNPDTDRITIQFDGGGDNFNSFYKTEVLDSKGKPLVGKWDCDDDMDFLFKMMDESKVFYDWVSCTMSGTIKYINKRLFIENTNCSEPNIWVDDYNEDGEPLDSDGNVVDESEAEWDCEDYIGLVLDDEEEDYDVYDLDLNGFTSDEKLEMEKQKVEKAVIEKIETSVNKPKSKPKKIKKSKKTAPKQVKKKNVKKVVKKKTKKVVVKKKVSKPVKKSVKKKPTKKKK